MAIDAKKIYEDLRALGNIGFAEGEGTSRVAYSEAFITGRDLVQKLMENAGLKVSTDPIGNLSGLLEGTEPNAARIIVGSHIDSVPNGGIYDGCLGVMSAIECIREMKRSDFRPVHSIEVIAFTEEEGNAVIGTFGSKCFTGGTFAPAEIQKSAVFQITEADILQARRNSDDYKAYLELHIEQGGILEKEAIDIGIVEGIVGITRWKVEMQGDANHAGTTPMYLRNDAMQKTVVALNELYNTVSARADGMVCTIGICAIENPAINVIPSKTSFCIETRHSDPKVMQDVIHNWMSKYEPLGLTHSLISDQSETRMNPAILDLIEDSCKDMHYSYKRMFSGAGHDAMNLANFTPSAMIFIPSVDGISHNLKEFSTDSDIQKGTQILYDVLCKISSSL